MPKAPKKVKLEALAGEKRRAEDKLSRQDLIRPPENDPDKNGTKK